MIEKDTIYLVGDSYVYTSRLLDKVWHELHWSKQLEKKFPNKIIKNISQFAVGNFGITLQLDQAIADPRTFFVIVNPSDLFRTILPTSTMNRREESPEIDPSINDDTYRLFHEKFYKSSYINEFLTGDRLMEQIGTKPITLGPTDPELKLKYMTFGPWSFEQEATNRTPRLSLEVVSYMLNYYRFHFDINLRFAEDYNLIEGRLFKLLYKKIPFLFSLNGLATPIMKFLYPDVDNLIDNDLKPYFSEINLSRLKKGPHNLAPYYHNNDIDELKMITEYYYQRIKEITGYTSP